MGDVVNLRHVRKAQARTEKERTAEQNRAKFGRTKAEKARDETGANRAARTLDQAKIEKDD